MAEPPYRIQYQERYLVVRVCRDLFDREELAGVLDCLPLESARRGSASKDRVLVRWAPGGGG